MVIRLDQIEVCGEADAGRFAGILQLSPGLQVVSARNAYGKSLACAAIAWCLGIEPIFGIPDNDPSCFPEAVREELELPNGSSTPVISSECSVRLRHHDGRRLKLTREIKGDPKSVRVEEQTSDGKTRNSKLLARRGTMQDEHGGLQRFLFEWMKWPRHQVTTFRGAEAEVYLENLAPAFYIDQDEGWTNIQALQIGRYGQQQIAEIAVEYLLGAIDAIDQRVARQQASQRSLSLRETARALAERINKAFLRRGWRVEWSGHGPVDEILTRWSARTLEEVLSDQANVDLGKRRIMLSDRVDNLRRMLTTGPVDASNLSAPAEASQRVIQLKQSRHKQNRDLNTLRIQYEQTNELLMSLDHRIRAATDLLRLKTTGIGRLDHVECPTCHRDLDPDTFALTEQSTTSIESHIEAIKRDRDLMSKNLRSLESTLESGRGALTDLDTELRAAESALLTVTNAVGTVREQVAQTAANLTSAEREMERVVESAQEITELQDAINKWILDARGLTQQSGGDTKDAEKRRQAFLNALRRYLTALGHSAIKPETTGTLQIDEQYTPYLNGRRLRSLGSASDQSRLVAAYSLGLAAASEQVHGFHPGVVILDEPLQQNPDEPHRELFLSFLSKELARDANFQTIIFTWLPDDEIRRLREQGTNVITPEGDHFLQLLPNEGRPSS